MCPADKRFLVLYTFIKKNRKKKVMIFFSSCMAVKFYHELLNYIDLPVMCIHVSMVVVLIVSGNNKVTSTVLLLYDTKGKNYWTDNNSCVKLI